MMDLLDEAVRLLESELTVRVHTVYSYPPVPVVKDFTSDLFKVFSSDLSKNYSPRRIRYE
jgi:hypothetical protein